MNWDLELLLELYELWDATTTRIRDAARADNRFELAVQLCARAWIEMRLRDLWAPQSPRREVWDRFMQADVAAAQRLISRRAA